jgi:UDP-N-acetylglucosamine acyltransferase
MNANIHPSAVIDATAQIDPQAKIGPFAVIEAKAIVGAGTVIGPHVVLGPNTVLGRDNRVFAQACLGLEPQDFKFKGDNSRLVIGDGNVFRESVTIHRATGEGKDTVIGNQNFFMNFSHVAHNCVIGNNVTLANCATLAGHVVVENNAFISGMTGVHQFARIGTFAMVGALSRLSKDVLPYSTTAGCDKVEVFDLNKVGLRRAGLKREAMDALHGAFRLLRRPDLTAGEAFKELEAIPVKTVEVEHLIQFIRTSTRGYYR